MYTYTETDTHQPDTMQKAELTLPRELFIFHTMKSMNRRDLINAVSFSDDEEAKLMAACLLSSYKFQSSEENYEFMRVNYAALSRPLNVEARKLMFEIADSSKTVPMNPTVAEEVFQRNRFEITPFQPRFITDARLSLKCKIDRQKPKWWESLMPKDPEAFFARVFSKESDSEEEDDTIYYR